MRKPTICIGENKAADQLCSNLLQSFFFFNPKFQVSSLLLWLYRPVCVGPGRKPKLLVLSRTGSYYTCTCIQMSKNYIYDNGIYCYWLMLQKCLLEKWSFHVTDGTSEKFNKEKE